MPLGIKLACARRCANFPRDGTSTNSASSTSLAQSSNSPAWAPSTRRRVGPAAITPETGRSVSSRPCEIRKLLFGNDFRVISDGHFSRE